MNKNCSFIVDLADLFAQEIIEIFKHNPHLKKEQFYLDLTELSLLQKKNSNRNKCLSSQSLQQLCYISKYLLSKLEFTRLGTMVNIINTEHPKYITLCVFTGCLIVYRMNKCTMKLDKFLSAILPKEEHIH